MRTLICAAAAALVLGVATYGNTQPPSATPADTNLPAPGTRGNADNVPFIGKSDPQGNPVRLAKASGHVSNYSEEKVPPFTLPNPLVLTSGEPVTSADVWWKQRRPEILKFYQAEIYGRIPDNAPKVTWEVTETDANARDGAAMMRRVVGRMGDKPDGPRMNLTVYLPAQAKGPVPMLLSISFNFGAGRGGNAAKTPQASAKGRGPGGGFDSIGEVLGRGWGYASLAYTDIQPDRPNQIGRAHV